MTVQEYAPIDILMEVSTEESGFPSRRSVTPPDMGCRFLSRYFHQNDTFQI